MSTLSQDRVRTSEETLRRLLKSWRSRYRSIILLKSQTPRVLVFQTEWARRPTPHEPLPDIRVHVDFSFLFDTTYDETGAKVPLPPSLTYRIEEEELVHRDLTNNIDHHILRHIKFKTEFARRNPLPLTVDQSEYFASRFAYEPLDVIADTHLDSFVDFADQAANDVRGVEKNLIDMFQRADNDRNGSLDPEEFEDVRIRAERNNTRAFRLGQCCLLCIEPFSDTRNAIPVHSCVSCQQLLLNSKWGFTKEDVAVVMAQHDAVSDRAVDNSTLPLSDSHRWKQQSPASLSRCIISLRDLRLLLSSRTTMASWCTRSSSFLRLTWFRRSVRVPMRRR